MYFLQVVSEVPVKDVVLPPSPKELIDNEHNVSLSEVKKEIIVYEVQNPSGMKLVVVKFGTNNSGLSSTYIEEYEDKGITELGQKIVDEEGGRVHIYRMDYEFTLSQDPLARFSQLDQAEAVIFPQTLQTNQADSSLLLKKSKSSKFFTKIKNTLLMKVC